MAQKHKAPTQVTLVQEEKGTFAQWIETHWRKLALVAALVIAAILLWQQFSRKAVEGREAEHDSLRAALVSLRPDELARASEELAGSGLEGWADLMDVQLAIVEERFADAKAKLAAFKAKGSASPLLTGIAFPLGPDGQGRNLLENLEAALISQNQQVADLSLRFDSPDPPAGAPRVRLITSEGEITIALYPEAAPLHVANFLKLAQGDHYPGTRFHRVIKGFMVQGGDPKTKDPTSDRATWGQGAPDEEKIPSEADNGLVHAPFMLAAAKQPGEQESSSTQFYITTGPAHHLDGEHTVYGKVIDALSEATVRRLGATPILGDQPVDPPLLQRVEILSGD